MAFRFRIRVPSSYTDEAQVMLSEHPRTSVVQSIANWLQDGSDLLVIVSSDPKILTGLMRWWQGTRDQVRARPPLALVQTDDSVIQFDDHSIEEMIEFATLEPIPGFI